MEKPLTLKDAASYLGVSPITIRRLLARGDGPRYFRVGKQLRFTKEALADYLCRGEQEQEQIKLKRKAAFLGVSTDELSRLRGFSRTAP